jgi:hypothetical protein
MYALWDDENDKLLAGPQSVGDDNWLPVVDEVGDYDPLTHTKRLERSGDVLAYVLEAKEADWASVNRGKRDKLLRDSDWTQLPDVPLATKEAWATYRQALRDLPEHPNWPDLNEADWPVVLN